jgi:hypothetical protein
MAGNRRAGEAPNVRANPCPLIGGLVTRPNPTKWRAHRVASPAQYIFSQAEFTLSRAEADPVGRRLECMVAMTLAAFAMEAFLNLLGEQTFCDKYGESEGLRKWERLERRLGAQEKLDLLVAMHGFGLDTTKEPYSLIAALFKYRNMIAHGRTWRSGDVMLETGSHILTTDPDDFPEFTPPWFKKATLANARKYVRAVGAAADELLLKTGFIRGLRISDSAWAEEVEVSHEAAGPVPELP